MTYMALISIMYQCWSIRPLSYGGRHCLYFALSDSMRYMALISIVCRCWSVRPLSYWGRPFLYFFYRASRVPHQLRIPREVPAPTCTLLRKPIGCGACGVWLIRTQGNSAMEVDPACTFRSLTYDIYVTNIHSLPVLVN